MPSAPNDTVPVFLWLDHPGTVDGDAGVIVQQDWLRDVGLVRDARVLLRALFTEISALSNLAPGDQMPHLVAWLAANRRSDVHVAIALFYGVTFAAKSSTAIDSRLPSIVDFVRFAGLDDRSLVGTFTQRTGSIARTLLIHAPHDLTAQAKRALLDRARRAWYVADRIIAPIVEAEGILLTFALSLMAGPVIAGLGPLGLAMDFSFRGFLFLVDFHKFTEDGELTGGEVFPLIVHTLGFHPSVRLQQVLGAIAVVATVFSVLVLLYEALTAIISFDQLDRQLAESGAEIQATDKPVRLEGDVLQALLLLHPELDTQIGRSTEADFRAKVLNALVRNQELADAPRHPSLAHLPSTASRLMALESLDPDTMRTVKGRSSANPFDANKPNTFPRLVAYLLEVVDTKAMAKPENHGQRIVSHYERVLVYMETKTEAVSILENIGGKTNRRPDYVQFRYKITPEELAAGRDANGKVQPVFDTFLKGLAANGKFLKVVDAVLKSVDFNTFLGGDARAEHIDKHQRTVGAVLVHLQMKLRIKLLGVLGIFLTDYYHLTPQVSSRGSYVFVGIDKHTISQLVDAPENPGNFEILTEAKPGHTVKPGTERERFIESAKNFADSLRKVIEVLRKKG